MRQAVSSFAVVLSECRKRVGVNSHSKTVVAVKRSKCLPQRDKDLGGFDSSQRIEVVPQIDSHRANRRSVTQADSQSIGVGRKVAKSDVLEYVSTVVESDHSQTFLDRNRNTK